MHHAATARKGRLPNQQEKKNMFQNSRSRASSSRSLARVFWCSDLCLFNVKANTIKARHTDLVAARRVFATKPRGDICLMLLSKAFNLKPPLQLSRHTRHACARRVSTQSPAHSLLRDNGQKNATQRRDTRDNNVLQHMAARPRSTHVFTAP